MKKSKPIDPVNALPRETFCGLFKDHLPLSSTATSSAVSRNWRQVLLSDPTLYNEVDTSKFKYEDEILPLLYHLNRYTALSRNRIAICNLQLDAFLREKVASYSLGRPGSTANGFDCLLINLSNSRESLREITIRADEAWNLVGSDRSVGPKEVFSMMFSLLDLLTSFPVLKKIVIEIPLHTSFKIGNGDSTSRTISVLNSDADYLISDRHEERQVGEIHHFTRWMRKAMEFAGEKFEEFSLIRGVDRLSMDDRVEILGMLNHSRQTLHKLEFDIEGWYTLRFDEREQMKRRYIQFAMTCPHLRQISIMASLTASKELETGETQPSASSSSTVVSTKFEIDHDVVDWDYWCNWVGTSLEELEMRIRGHNLSTSGSFGMILNSIQSLKDLYLSLDHEMVEQEDFLDQPLTFPNVERLSLFGLNSSTSRLFSEANFPKLRTLLVFDLKHPRTTFDCLVRLLERYDKQLLTLRLLFLISKGHPFNVPSSSIKLHFPRLRHLEFFPDCDEGVIKWFNQFSFPMIESEEEQEHSEEEQE